MFSSRARAQKKIKARNARDAKAIANSAAKAADQAKIEQLKALKARAVIVRNVAATTGVRLRLVRRNAPKRARRIRITRSQRLHRFCRLLRRQSLSQRRRKNRRLKSLRLFLKRLRIRRRAFSLR